MSQGALEEAQPVVPAAQPVAPAAQPVASARKKHARAARAAQAAQAAQPVSKKRKTDDNNLTQKEQLASMRQTMMCAITQDLMRVPARPGGSCTCQRLFERSALEKLADASGATWPYRAKCPSCRETFRKSDITSDGQARQICECLRASLPDPEQRYLYCLQDMNEDNSKDFKGMADRLAASLQTQKVVGAKELKQVLIAAHHVNKAFEEYSEKVVALSKIKASPMLQDDFQTTVRRVTGCLRFEEERLWRPDDAPQQQPPHSPDDDPDPPSQASPGSLPPDSPPFSPGSLPPDSPPYAPGSPPDSPPYAPGSPPASPSYSPTSPRYD